MTSATMTIADSARCGDDLNTFDGAEHGDRGRDDAVAVEQRSAEQS